MKVPRAVWSFPGHNRTFTVALLLAAAVRVVTLLAFRPAIWFGGDSAGYVAVALRLRPDARRISGYGVFFLVLRPLPSFPFVPAPQPVFGLLIALPTYGLLRPRFRLPAWGAPPAPPPRTLAA